jgi:hypothetical protein
MSVLPSKHSDVILNMMNIKTAMNTVGNIWEYEMFEKKG